MGDQDVFPLFAGGLEVREANGLGAVGVMPIFIDAATIGGFVDLVGAGFGTVLRVKDVPVAEPEVELAVGGIFGDWRRDEAKRSRQVR